jgi:hypothetical protein
VPDKEEVVLVSNLLVVLCVDEAAQALVNNGTLN